MSVQFLGDLFLKALLMLVVPLVMASIIVGVSGLGDVRRLGGLGVRTLVYFLTTTGLAVVMGIVLVTTIQPGNVANEAGHPAVSGEQVQTYSDKLAGQPQTIGQLIKEVLVSLVPHNLFAAMANTDVLPLIVFSVIFGAILTTIGERGQVLTRFFQGVNEVVMKIVHLLMWTAPVGIGALIAGRLGQAGGFSGFWPELASLGSYAVTVILGLMIQGMVILPLVLRFITRTSPWAYGKQLGTALTTAFSTSSSSATLPVTPRRGRPAERCR